MAEPKIVDEYQIRVAQRDGFTNLNLSLKTSDGTVAIYEFPPAFAHRLSDELVRASARAAAKG